MPKIAYTRRQDHSTRGTKRDGIRDGSTYSLDANGHVVVNLADLGIATPSPTRAALNMATTKYFRMVTDALTPPADIAPEDTEIDDDDIDEELESEDSDTKFGGRTYRQIKRADNGLIRDWDHIPEDDKFNGSDRPWSGFHIIAL